MYDRTNIDCAYCDITCLYFSVRDVLWDKPYGMKAFGNNAEKQNSPKSWHRTKVFIMAFSGGFILVFIG